MATDNQVDLSAIQDAPNPNLIECLESLMADAKTGELQSIVYVASWRGNFVGGGWSDMMRNRKRIMGELYQMLHNLAGLEDE